jgi:hypothetical protein
MCADKAERRIATAVTAAERSSTVTVGAAAWAAACAALRPGRIT